MRVSLLNLISTPVPVLNSLRLNLRVGLSSEDPMVIHHATEEYSAYASIYSPEGLLLERAYLGLIPPNRRKFFDLSETTRNFVPTLDHLVVVHRVPTLLLDQVAGVDDDLEMPEAPEYAMFRSVVEYSYPQGGNGSVIYETPPRLNAGPSSNTLSFTCQVLLSDTMNTNVVLINYSVDPSYSRIANYNFGVYSPSGEQVASGATTVSPFGVRMLDMEKIIPKTLVRSGEGLPGGLSPFTFFGYSDDAAVMVLAVNGAPALGAVAVEHIHPPQTYIFPWDPSYRITVKTEAQSQWRSILSGGGSG